jgi:ABC-type branched-subunit amino acid transport system ATPase component/ABC-type branched-subunit amino acid transport system permease subunit
MRARAIDWRRALPLAGLLALLAFPLIAREDLYRQTVLFQTFLLAVGAVSWNIISGFTGYISLGQSAFLGLGAYTTALLSLHLDISPFIVAPVGGLVAAAFAALVGAVVLRARGHSFVIITIALVLLLQIVALNTGSLTGGSNGLTLPLPRWSADYQYFPFYYGMLGLMILTFAFGSWIRRTKFGTGLIAIREDEDKAATIGINTTRYKILSFTSSAVFVGVAGGIYAYFLTFIDPRGMFDILTSVTIVLAALVGGRGTVWGPLLGAFIIQPLNDLTTVYAEGSQSRLVLFGGLLVAIVLFLPEGIVPGVSKWLMRRRTRSRAVEAIDPGPTAASSPPPSLSAPASQPGGSALIEVIGLTKAFGGLRAVDDCNFTVREGTLTGLIGPNGSGKTTLFNLVTGMMLPDEGSIRLGGRRIDQLSPWQRAHMGLGRTFQLTRLFDAMSVLDNVVAPLPEFRWGQLRADAVGGREAERAGDLLEFVGMRRFLHTPAGELSFGQKKLVELAQVLMLDPKLILLDEPMGGINPAVVDRLVHLIRELNGRGITFLIVEHNMPVVLDLCDPIIVIARGKQLAEGSAGEIQNDSIVLDAYLGEQWASGRQAGATR